jgi:glutamyl/glutaminyl-tRNA synthetase
VFVSRLAPSPTGYLHAGNAVNMILTAKYIQNTAGQLWLRIDDADTGRSKPEYVADIFESLRWLDITYDHGPKNPAALADRFSQDHRRNHYLAVAEQLLDLGSAYACDCTRAQAVSWQLATAPHPCASAAITFERGQNTIRFRSPASTRKDTADPAALGDFVIWRRDDLPAYQLVSVIEDQLNGINTIVRGMDLLASSSAQCQLATALGAANVVNAQFFHHPLLTGPTGKKLSKSNKAPSLHGVGSPDRAELFAIADDLYQGTFSDSTRNTKPTADSFGPDDRVVLRLPGADAES